MSRITPFLWYDTQAEEAAAYYVSIFPNSRMVEITRCGEAGPGPAGSVLLVHFELDGKPFFALNGGPMVCFNMAVSFTVSCANQAEVDYYWERLGAGGEEQACGWLKDRYGLSWQVTPDRLVELLSHPEPGTAARAMRAMQGMRKIDIAALEAACAE